MTTNTARPLDATEFLIKAHQEMKQLFDEYAQLVSSNADTEDKRDAAEDICTMVTAHAMVEDELFYPAVRQVLDDDFLLNIAEVEHEGASSLVHVIRSIEPTDPLYDARVQVLADYVIRHADREERELFPKIRTAGIDLGSLGAQMEARQAELLEGGVF
jgi:hemerythrin superfamily protein